MSDSTGIFAAPTGRRLDQNYDAKRLGSVGVLRPCNPELGDLLRRRIREIRDRDLAQSGKTWTEAKTGEQFEVVREFVDPTAPADALAVAFVVRDHLVVFLKPIGSKQPVKSVHMGEMRGGRVA